LLLDSSGNLFGSAEYGGGHDQDVEGKGGGTIFKFGAGTLSVLHAFCAEANCADGEDPEGTLISDPKATCSAPPPAAAQPAAARCSG